MPPLERPTTKGSKLKDYERERLIRTAERVLAGEAVTLLFDTTEQMKSWRGLFYSYIGRFYPGLRFRMEVEGMNVRIYGDKPLED